ncbi:MAG: MmcQ/YjbR family DNA-binding protein [Acutalibacteraceae bacterium]|jgi:predicted DNA-binding protein (MmcQ/YjbR family)
MAYARDGLLAYAADRFGVKPDYPWEKYPGYAVLRHRDSGKWFALLAPVPGDKLGLADPAPVEVVNLKCDPRMIGSLILNEGFAPAYHMNKLYWISVLLNGRVSDGQIEDLLDMSYALTENGRKRP